MEKYITLTVTPNELADLQTRAADADVSVVGYIRDAIDISKMAEDAPNESIFEIARRAKREMLTTRRRSKEWR